MSGDGGRSTDHGRLRRVEALYHQIVGRPASEREAALLAACPDDAEMRAEVRSLLAQPDSAAGFLSSPAMEVAAASVSRSSPSLTGQRIGVFEVRELLGVGGMGEVYRARDSKLGRDVAIKILPRAFKDDPDRAARFRREAHLLASLNHPNIGAVYGLEDADDLQALVLELVEGEDLSERLARGAVPVAEALPIARQIAEALEAAHERGVIHRDLKPGNIKLRPDGAVKVLDFGLAKATEAADPQAADPTNSPTLTARATKIGMILGTAAYMAPEQALGKSVDRRADIWSFGVVLYEMLTGTRAFKGDDVPSTLEAVLSETPSFAALPKAVPIRIRRLLERCLDRDPKTRLRDIGEARIEIAQTERNVPLSTHAPAPGAATASRWVAASAALVGLLIAAAAFTLWGGRSRVSPESHISMHLGPNLQFPGLAAYVALSPDGRTVVFTATKGTGAGQQSVGRGDLHLRKLDQMNASPLGVAGQSPFFSPDGRWLGFVDAGKIKKMPLLGGVATEITDCSGCSADWGPNGVIVFGEASDQPTEGIRWVSASGGPVATVTTLDRARGDTHHFAPQLLPDGATVLFTIRSAGPKTRLAVVPLKGGAPRMIVEDATFGRYLGGGILLFQRGNSLLASRFDEERFTLGENVPVLGGVDLFWRNPAWSVANGTLVYRPEENRARSLLWVTREGVAEALGAPPRTYGNPRLSPRGDRIAATVFRGDGSIEVWTYDVGSRRLVKELGNVRYAVWTPDGARLLAHRPSVPADIVSLKLDGSGAVETLARGDHLSGPSFLTKDGRNLVFHQIGRETGYDLMVTEPGGSAPARPFIQTPRLEAGARLHPSERWVAYATNLDGREDVFVTRFPEGDIRVPVTIDGGREPVWSVDGKELFYRQDTKMFAARLRPGGNIAFDPPRLLFDVAYYQDGGAGQTQYDVASDGRFLMMKAPERETQYFGVILNWTDALNKAVARP